MSAEIGANGDGGQHRRNGRVVMTGAGSHRRERRPSIENQSTAKNGGARGSLFSASYPGGKSGAGVFQRIINLMPPHEVYIEPFLGGGAVMRLKRPAAVNIGLDLDERVIARAAGLARLGECGPGGIGETGDGRRRPAFRFQVGDGIRFLRTYRFQGDELVYCDPPYLRSTRSSQRALYAHEMDDEQHRALLKTIKRLPCRVMISGYFSNLYAAELKGWNSVRFRATTRGGVATEWVWFNFAAPVALHDYRYLGRDFRERERIKRKKQRWLRRLGRMPALERQALLSAISAMVPGASL